jgi:hypothetical protein
MSNLLTLTDLAVKLSADEETVVKWQRRYHWPHVKIGRALRWTPEQADEIVRRHAVTAPESKPVVVSGQTARSARRAS